MSVSTLTLNFDSRLYRYDGGKFIGVWERGRLDGTNNSDYPVVPDDMIALGEGDWSAAGLREIIMEYAEEHSDYDQRSVKAIDLPTLMLNREVTHIRRFDDPTWHQIKEVRVVLVPDNSTMLSIIFFDGSVMNLLPSQESTGGKLKKTKVPA